MKILLCVHLIAPSPSACQMSKRILTRTKVYSGWSLGSVKKIPWAVLYNIKPVETSQLEF